MPADRMDMLDTGELNEQTTIEFVDNFVLRTSSGVILGGLNDGREEAAQQIGVQGVQISAILDEKTCPFCEAKDELEIKIDGINGQQLLEENTPPFHDHCRCTHIYVIDDEENFNGDNEGFDKRWESNLKSLDPKYDDYEHEDMMKQFANKIVQDDPEYIQDHLEGFVEDETVSVSQGIKRGVGELIPDMFEEGDIIE